MNILRMCCTPLLLALLVVNSTGCKETTFRFLVTGSTAGISPDDEAFLCVGAVVLGGTQAGRILCDRRPLDFGNLGFTKVIEYGEDQASQMNTTGETGYQVFYLQFRGRLYKPSKDSQAFSNAADTQNGYTRTVRVHFDILQASENQVQDVDSLKSIAPATGAAKSDLKETEPRLDPDTLTVEDMF